MPVFRPNSQEDIKVICIDAGHGGMDGGAFVSGIKESELDLSLALKLKTSLELEGFEIIMTRTSDTSLPEGSSFIKRTDLNERLKLINQADLFISIHMNTYTNSIYRGSQVFYNNVNTNNKILAKTLMDTLKLDLKNTTREEKFIDTIYLLKQAKTCGVIVECGFMSNPDEFLLLQNDNYQLEFVKSITKGILTYRYNIQR